MSLTVLLYAQGMMNTIILVAPRHCRPDQDEIIATDSKCSMDIKVAKHIRNPILTADDCHQPMLEAIANLLIRRARASLQTTLMKVKSLAPGAMQWRTNQQTEERSKQNRVQLEQCDIDVSHKYLENFENKLWPKQKNC